MNDSRVTSQNQLLANDVHLARDVLMKLAARTHADHDAADTLQQWFDEPTCARLGVFALPKNFLLSVVIPVYNEAATIREVIDAVHNVALPCEIIVVDDGSTDGTRDLLAAFEKDADVRVIHQTHNQGKGAALKVGFGHARGTLVAIQDGDLEYDPRDLCLLVAPILAGQADVVYGSRFGYADGIVSNFVHQRGNQLITRLSNFATGLKLTDVETCYKVFRRDVIEQIAPMLREQGFGIELEITAKVARLPGIRIAERPVSYTGRSYAEGKKIGWRDAIWAMYCIARY